MNLKVTHQNCARYRKGINKGILKIISKMGISTISSYRGSQLFEIVGLNDEVVETCFTNTVSRIQGKSFDDLDKQIRKLDDYARSNLSDISVGGLLKYVHGVSTIHIILRLLKNFKRQFQLDQWIYIEEYSSLVDDRPPAMLEIY